MLNSFLFSAFNCYALEST